MYIRLKNGHEITADYAIMHGNLFHVCKTKEEGEAIVADLTAENLSKVTLVADAEVATYKAVLISKPVCIMDGGLWNVFASFHYVDERVDYLTEMKAIQDAAIEDLAEAVSNLSEV